MPTSYTSLLGLALPVTGELSGTWGATVNDSITSLLDTAVAGTTSITTDADITLTTTTGASNQARQAIILWNPASGTTTRNITAPAQSKIYTVINASGGTQSIVFRGVGPTTGVTIVKGEAAVVTWNGSDFIKVSNTSGAGTFTDLTVTGNTTLGDVVGDTLTVNATSTFNNANLTLNAGTANGVAYLNGSKVLTTGSALVFDGSNLGLGVTPSATSVTGYRALEIGAVGSGFLGGANDLNAAVNAYYNTGLGGWIRANTSAPARYQLASGAHVFYTAAAGTTGTSFSFTQAMTLDASGNLGIGITSPGQKLHVENSVNSSTWTKISNGNSGTGAAAGVLFGTDQGDAGALSQNSSNAGYGTAANAVRLRNLLNAPITFETNNTERARIDSSGNLGLGVTPSAWGSGQKAIQVGSSGAINGSSNTSLVVVSANRVYNGTNDLYINTAAATAYQQSSGAHAWFTAASGTAGNAITFTQAMTLDASGNLQIGNTSYAYRVAASRASDGIVGYFRRDGATVNPALTISCNETGNTVGFGTDYAGATSPAITFSTQGTERARITSGGDLLVGTTDAGATTGVGVKTLYSATIPAIFTVFNTAGGGNAYNFYNTNATNNGYRFYVKVDGGIANYQANDLNLSDQRLKKDISDAGSYLEKICSIPVRTFRYKDQSDSLLTLGVIAQEVEKVAPELVNNDGFGDTPDDGVPLKTIYQTDLQYALMKCIQELKADLDATKAELAALKGA
jgi:hypothetical protein